MNPVKILDRASGKKESGRLLEAVLLQGKAWSIRYLEDGSTFKEERFTSELHARLRWDVVKRGFEKAEAAPC